MKKTLTVVALGLAMVAFSSPTVMAQEQWTVSLCEYTKADDKNRIRELERELRRKDAALAETAALLVLRKKLNAYWGSDDEAN